MIAKLLMTTALSSALVLTGPMSQAAAQDRVYDWTGFYAGFGASGVATGSTITFSTGTTNLPVPKLGAGFTIQGGYNLQQGQFVFGLEAENTILAAPEIGSNGDYAATSHLEELLNLRARIGIAADRMLFFATAGYGGGRASFTTDSGYGTPDSVGSGQGIVSGPVGGVGIEYAATDKVSIKAELKAYSMSTISDSGKAGFLTNYTGTYHPRGALLTVGANFHF
jgi:outer membrane immunogenic protein